MARQTIRTLQHLTKINQRIFFEMIHQKGRVFTYSDAFMLDEDMTPILQ